MPEEDEANKEVDANGVKLDHDGEHPTDLSNATAADPTPDVIPTEPAENLSVEDNSADDPQGEAPPSLDPETPMTNQPPPEPNSGATRPPHQAPPTAGPRRLTRSRDRKVGGVAGGLAEYFAIDPVITRLAFVLAVFAGGLGVAAYVIAWIVLPDSDGEAPPRQPGDRSFDTTTVVALALLGVAATVALADSFDGGLVVPVVLVGAGVYLLTQRENDIEGVAATATAAPPPTAPVAFTGAGPESPWEPSATGISYDPPPTTSWSDDPTLVAPPPPAPPRRPAVVTRLTMSALALFFAGAIVGQQAGWFDTSVSTVLAIGLAIIGLGLVVGAFVGRSRGLVWFGLLTAVAFSASSVVEPIAEDGVGERSYAPVDLGEMADEYRLGIGDLEVDLTSVDIPDGDEVTVKVVLGVGEATVLVPPLTNLVVEGDVDVGQLNILEKAEDGIDNELRLVRDFGADSELTVILEVGLGEGSVIRNG